MRRLSSRRGGTSPESGFTLLELVISLVLLGVIVLIISGAMRLGLRSIESGEKKIDSLERLRTSMNIVMSQVQSEVPLTRVDNGKRKFYFEGSGDEMQFATQYSIWSGQRGFVLARYKVISSNNGKYSLTASENVVGTESDTESSRETVLFNALDSLSFEYYYQDPTEEKGSWVETWSDSTTTPTKIKMHFTRGKKEFSMIIPMRTPGLISADPNATTPATTPAGKITTTPAGRLRAR